jgi:hypothetical protein
MTGLAKMPTRAGGRVNSFLPAGTDFTNPNVLPSYVWGL